MNGTTISEYILLSFRFSCTLQAYLSILVLACYIIILLGNFLILTTLLFVLRLQHSLMFLLLANLSLIDLTLGSVAAPKLAADLFNCGHTISFGGCMAQLFFLRIFGGAKMLLLTLMAYDCYVAICFPLWYTAIMSRQRCLILLMVCWIGGLLHSTIQMAIVAHLPLCGPNVLDDFYCDVPQVIKLACMDTYIFEILVIVNSSFLTLPSFLSLLLSYIIILTILYGHFVKGGGGGKALSTCSFNLMVVCLVYVPCVIVYLKPLSTSHVNKMVPVATPALNPFIYTLRNQEVKEAMRKLKHMCKLHMIHQ